MALGKRQAPSGRTIWKAVRDELELNLYALPFSTLAPSVYHIYLHPEDFAAIEGVVPTLVGQIRQALSAEVETLNRASSSPVRSLVSRWLERETLPPIDVPSGGWQVHITRDPDGDLQPGQLGIISMLAVPAPVEYEGTPTTRIVRSVVGETGRVSTVRHEPLVAAADPRPAANPTPPSPSPVQHPTEARTVRDRARLTYTDEQGRHTFTMRKDVVSIGRGGSAVWVDVQVSASSRVSREHVRLRADADGSIFAQDVSLWGTTVDDAPIPPAVKGPEGVAQPGAEFLLPARARIGLAGVVTIEFEAL
jgi:hypothetical protein